MKKICDKLLDCIASSISRNTCEPYQTLIRVNEHDCFFFYFSFRFIATFLTHKQIKFDEYFYHRMIVFHFTMVTSNLLTIRQCLNRFQIMCGLIISTIINMKLSNVVVVRKMNTSKIVMSLHLISIINTNDISFIDNK